MPALPIGIANCPVVSCKKVVDVRNRKIDLLRFIGLVMIVFAHSDLPGVLFQLRNFDVPLIVLVSGMSFGLTFKGNISYFQYIQKRIKRLLFPTWIFLTIYFLCWPLLESSATPNSGARGEILKSYLLMSGFGGNRFMWIVGVFLLVAFVSPLIYSVYRHCKTSNEFLAKLIAAFAAYEVCRYLLVPQPFKVTSYWGMLTLAVLCMVAYSLIFALGLSVSQNSNRKNFLLSLLFLVMFSVLASSLWYVNGDFVQTQAYKYPPSFYFFSYAMSVSIFLWAISDRIWRIVERVKPIENFVSFTAQNSLWTFFWHIPLYSLAQPLSSNFVVKFAFMFSVATFMTFLQTQIVNNVLIPRVRNDRIRKDLKGLLTG